MLCREVLRHTSCILFCPPPALSCLLAQLLHILAVAQPICPKQPTGTIISLSPVTVAGSLLTNPDAGGSDRASWPSLLMKPWLHNLPHLSDVSRPASCTGSKHVYSMCKLLQQLQAEPPCSQSHRRESAPHHLEPLVQFVSLLSSWIVLNGEEFVLCLSPQHQDTNHYSMLQCSRVSSKHHVYVYADIMCLQ